MDLSPGLVRAAERLLPRWLIDRIDPFEAEIDRIVRRASLETDRSMTVLDAGAGESRHAGGFSHCRYIALDRCVGDGRWNYRGIDVCADATQLPMADRSVDRVLCVVTLEHIEDPGAAIAEFGRVLRPGGLLYMVTPLMWEEHQAPHDYFRFTTWGLRSLLRRAGLEIREIEPIGGFFWLCGRRSVNLLSFFQSSWRWILFPFLLPLAGFAVPVFCYYLDFIDREKKHTLGHRLIAVR